MKIILLNHYLGQNNQKFYQNVVPMSFYESVLRHHKSLKIDNLVWWVRETLTHWITANCQIKSWLFQTSIINFSVRIYYRICLQYFIHKHKLLTNSRSWLICNNPLNPQQVFIVLSLSRQGEIIFFFCICNNPLTHNKCLLFYPFLDRE